MARKRKRSRSHNPSKRRRARRRRRNPESKANKRALKALGRRSPTVRHFGAAATKKRHAKRHAVTYTNPSRRRRHGRRRKNPLGLTGESWKAAVKSAAAGAIGGAVIYGLGKVVAKYPQATPAKAAGVVAAAGVAGAIVAGVVAGPMAAALVGASAGAIALSTYVDTPKNAAMGSLMVQQPRILPVGSVIANDMGRIRALGGVLANDMGSIGAYTAAGHSRRAARADEEETNRIVSELGPRR